MAKKGIRPYGPGKYDKIIDGYAHDVALDGGLDEEESYPDGGGWYGLLLLDKRARDAIHQAAHYAEDPSGSDLARWSPYGAMSPGGVAGLF